MDDRQEVEIGGRRNAVNDQIGQPGDFELASVGHFAGMAKQRKLLEHLHCLTNPSDHALGGQFVIGRNPRADLAQVIERLRREIKVQGRIRARLVALE